MSGNLGRQGDFVHRDSMRGRRETSDTNDILGRTTLHRPDGSMHCLLFIIPGPTPTSSGTFPNAPNENEQKTTVESWADKEETFVYKPDFRKRLSTGAHLEKTCSPVAHQLGAR